MLPALFRSGGGGFIPSDDRTQKMSTCSIQDVPVGYYSEEDEEYEESRSFELLRYHLIPDSYHSIDLSAKESKLALSLIRFTNEGFGEVNWEPFNPMFSKHADEFDFFKKDLFGAMARFVWNLYDEEDFENFEFADDIFNECEGIRQLVWSKGNCEPDLSLLNVSNYEKVREQDVCNLLRWCNENKSFNNDEKEFSKCDVVINGPTRVTFRIDCPQTFELAKAAMLSPENLDPNGAVKHQLRMELIGGKCSCIVDALYMQSWKNLNFQKVVSLIPKEKVKAHELLESLASLISEAFYRLVECRVLRLHYSGQLVTYPLSASNIFGSWKTEVLEVVKQADLKRRSEGRRFIGTDHLVFCLHQRLVSESVHAKNSDVLMSSDDEEEKHKDTVYHLYQKANKIAMELGHETIGLEHLYVSIITPANDDKCSWKDYVKRVRKVITKRKGKCEKEDQPHPDIWKFILEEKSKFSYTSIDLLNKIKDDSNKFLQHAIRDVLSEDKKKHTHQMTEGEMINSLKKIDINFFQSYAGQLFIVCMAVVVFTRWQHVRG